MIETLIIGSGFSALCSDIILKNFNTKILNFNKTNYSPSFLVHRKNLNFYKFFSTKGLSSGTINFDIYKNIQLHDHLTEGGNTNLWGGFIDISEVPIEFINLFKNSLKFSNNKIFIFFINEFLSLKKNTFFKPILSSTIILFNRGIVIKIS